MLGDLQGMMAQLKNAQAKIEETKKRLDSVQVEGKAVKGMVTAAVTANREVKTILIAEELLSDKEALEDYLILALNNALKKANEIHEMEMARAAKNGLPELPGLDIFK